MEYARARIKIHIDGPREKWLPLGSDLLRQSEASGKIVRPAPHGERRTIIDDDGRPWRLQLIGDPDIRPEPWRGGYGECARLLRGERSAVAVQQTYCRLVIASGESATEIDEPFREPAIEIRQCARSERRAILRDVDFVRSRLQFEI